MTQPRGFVLFALIVSGCVLGGCTSKAALPEKHVASAPAAAVSQARPVSKAAPRESAFSTYSNPEYGVAFRYPRNYALDEGAPEDIEGVRSEEELQSEQPGANLVATIVIPDDSYPNTTFAGGSLQLGVNPYLTAKGCRDFLRSRMGDSTGPTGVVTVQGVAFAWTENEEGDASTEFFERDYAGFSGGTCYEFFLRVGVGPVSDEVGVRPADEKRILSQLEKIVTSLQIQPKPVSILDEAPAAPDVHKKLEWTEAPAQNER
jgi:outer membrane murein-binding lipoprotein Lpp